MTNCDVFELVDLRLEVPQMKSSVDFPISVKSMKLARITQLCGSKACQIGRSRVIRYSPSSFIGHYLQLRATTFIWKWETSLILSARIPTRSLNPLLWLPILALLDKSEGRDPYHWCNHHCDGKHGHNCARRVSFPANLCRFHRKSRSLELLFLTKICQYFSSLDMTFSPFYNLAYLTRTADTASIRSLFNLPTFFRLPLTTLWELQRW